MIALLTRARAEREQLGYVTDHTRLLLSALGIGGAQLETYLQETQ